MIHFYKTMKNLLAGAVLGSIVAVGAVATSQYSASGARYPAEMIDIV